jgi:tRNA threonylcarbamoyladenosine biosynthesis protein TsaB
MTGLIIDTSGPWLNLALCREGKTLSSVSRQVGNRQAEELPRELVISLAAAKLSLSDIGWLAVTVGPGSFTGLRVGISFCQGLALGGNCRILPLNTLDAMVCLPEDFSGGLSPALDAKKGQIYTALYQAADGGHQRVSPCQVVDPGSWFSRLPAGTKIFGSGVLAYRELVQQSFSGLQVDDALVNGPEIKGLVKLAAQGLQQENFISPEDLDALYIRPSDAEVKPHA